MSEEECPERFGVFQARLDSSDVKRKSCGERERFQSHPILLRGHEEFDSRGLCISKEVREISLRIPVVIAEGPEERDSSTIVGEVALEEFRVSYATKGANPSPGELLRGEPVATAGGEEFHELMVAIKDRDRAGQISEARFQRGMIEGVIGSRDDDR
jgi:hypothetical protein